MKPTASTRRHFLKAATGIAFSAAAFQSLGPASAIAKQRELAPNKRNFVRDNIWFINIALDHLKLVPQIVQVAITDKDPVSGFTSRTRLLRRAYQQMLVETSAEFGPQRLSAQVGALWDSGFRDVRGDQVHLIVSGTPFQLCSNDRGGKQWVMTKCVEVEGRTVSWCFPVELRAGETIDIRLTDKNTFDLSGHYEAEM